MTRTLLLFLLILNACGSSNHVQHGGNIPSADALLGQAAARLQQVQDACYRITYRSKAFADSDTTLMQGRTCFMSKPEDEMGMWLHLWVEPAQDEFIYNSTNAYLLKHKDLIATRLPAVEALEFFQGSELTHLLYTPYTTAGEGFSSFQTDASIIEKKVMRDTTIRGQEAHTIYLRFKDEPPYNNVRQWYFLRKSDALPIGSTRMVGYEDKVQYTEELISDISIPAMAERGVFDSTAIPSVYTIGDEVKQQGPSMLSLGSEAPPFRLPSFKGDSIALADFKGKPIVVDFWYSSCVPCIQAAPFMERLYQTYKDKGVTVLGLNPIDTDLKRVQRFLDFKKVTYPILLQAAPVADAYKVSAYPTVYVIDKSGRVVYAGMGFSEKGEKELEAAVLKALGE